MNLGSESSAGTQSSTNLVSEQTVATGVTLAIRVVRGIVTCPTGVDRLGGVDGRGAWGRSGSNNAPKLPKMPLARRLELEDERQCSNNEVDVDFYTLCVPVW